MAIRTAGVKLEHQLIAKFLSDARSADDAYAKNVKSVLSLAEAERRATISIQGAVKQRTAAVNAESRERQAAAEKNIQAEKRQTMVLRAELAQQTAARQQAARAAQQAPTAAGGGGVPGFLSGAGSAALGLGLGFLGVQSIQQALQTTAELDRMAAQSRVTNIALTALAGGGGQAAEAIRQIQSVAPGSTNALEAAGAATTILTQKLNSSAVSVGEISKAISIIPQLSPSIKSTGDALAQLTLFSSSAAFARADQLLVTADAVKQRIQELQAAYPGLTDAQAKAAATVQLVNEQFKEVGDALAQNVPGIQKLTNAFEDLKLAVATGGIGPVDNFFAGIAEGINAATVASGGGTLDTQKQALADLRRELEAQQKLAEQRPVNLADAILPGINSGVFEQSINRLGVLEKEMENANKLAATGAPAALEYQKALQGIVAEVVDTREVGAEQGAQLAEIRDRYLDVSRAAETYADAQQKVAQEQAAIAEATNLAELNEVRAQVDELAKSSLDLFAGGAPGAGELSSALIELQTHLVGSTQLSEEDAAAVAEAAKQHQLLAAAAGQSVGGLDAAAQAKLNDQVAALQDAQANQVLAASLQAVAAAQAGVSRGIISNLSGLVGGGTLNQGQASAINRFQQQQAAAGFAGIQAQGLTGPALSFATADLERQLEAPFREWDEISKGITQEAHAQHQASQGASKEWNKAQKDAEKAAKVTLAVLQKVPGLFGTSPVTQEQIDAAKAGVPQNFADDFLRQLEDEVLNGVDREGVSIEQGREALERIGVTVDDDPKVVLQQLREAWENSSLFASKENLALINKKAVEDNLALQKKMEDGRKNVAELFGVAIDDSVAAIGAGGAAPFDQEALNKKLADAEAAFWDKVAEKARLATSFNTSGVSLSDQVREGTGGGLQEAVNGFTNTADILRGTFEGVTSTSDILREAFLKVDEAAIVFTSKLNDIPQVIWEDHIDEFPSWQGEEGIITDFPGWDAWLGSEKVNTGATDVGATGVAGTDTVPSLVQQSLTSPSVNTNNNTRNTTVTINTNQSTGSLISDWAVLEHQAR